MCRLGAQDPSTFGINHLGAVAMRRVVRPPLAAGAAVRLQIENQGSGFGPGPGRIGPLVEPAGRGQAAKLPFDPAAPLIHWLLYVGGAMHQLDRLVAVSLRL